jgi:alcohol dehydrogenase (cytochrome c)
VGDVDRLGYNNWLAGDRFSPLRQITPANAAALRAVCTYRLGERVPMESGPVVIGGTLYVTTARRTYAIDAATCALRWKHTYDYTPSPPYDLKVNRGLAYADGRLFRGANDGRVYALDARTGRALWNVAAADPSKGETFPAAPAVWRGLVFIGNAGGDNFGVRGPHDGIRRAHRRARVELRPGARVRAGFAKLAPRHRAGAPEQ